ncbi:MAG: hypothetical protein LC127_08260 [Chitinophagales bacterium]|nr:hypothetical protein [Chitinophagales bacterium]
MKGLLLLVCALGLAAVLLPIGFIYQLVRNLLVSSNRYLFKIAKSIDQLGNVVCESFFNLILIKDDSLSPFGNEDKTISTVLGLNKRLNNLTWLGKALERLLNLIDKNHVEKAILKD